MKQIVVLALLVCISFFQSCGQEDSESQANQNSEIEYINEHFGFSATVPKDWKLFGQIENDTEEHMAIVDWGLPKTYDDSLKVEIENSISITAYEKKEISSVSELILYEYLRIDPRETALEPIDSDPNARMIYTTTSDSLKYKGKSYYAYKNGIAYVITFMATPGTYNKNIKTFEDFNKRVKLF